MTDQGGAGPATARRRRQLRRRALAASAAVVLLAGLFLGGQVITGIGAENRCNDSAGSARYTWQGLEWRWRAAPPGVWCTWRDTETGRTVGAWAWGSMPEEHLAPRADAPSGD